jgi:hypothetical protein
VSRKARFINIGSKFKIAVGLNHLQDDQILRKTEKSATNSKTTVERDIWS